MFDSFQSDCDNVFRRNVINKDISKSISALFMLP